MYETRLRFFRILQSFQKESGPKVLSFSLNLALRGIHRYADTQNDTHYEIIGVDRRGTSIYDIACAFVPFSNMLNYTAARVQ